MIGQTISHYRIVEKFGGGGMGVVYKAEDTRLGRFVALKFLPEDVAETARLWSVSGARPRPLPPSTIPISAPSTTSASEDGQAFIAMEFLDGEDPEAPHRRPAARAGDLLALGIEIADALDAAHPRASSIATSSPRTSSSPSVDMPRCWISAWPRWRRRRTDAAGRNHLTGS